MKIQALIFLLSIVTLAGCGKVKEEEKKDNPLSPNGANSEKNITDRSVCNGELTDRGSIFRNPWIDIRKTSKNIIIMDTFVFKGSTLTKRTVCSYDNKSVEVIVNADVGISEKVNEIVVINGAKATEPITVGNRDYPCTAEILKTEDPIKFQFEGDCLHLIPTAETAISYPPGFW